MSEPRLHWLEAAGGLQRWRRPIEAEVAGGWDAASAHATLPVMDLLIQRVPQAGIPELGMVGNAHRPHCFSLTLDPDNPAFIEALAGGALRRLVVHEIGHCLRFAAAGYDHTLGDALVSEGLCGHFVHQCLGTPPEPWESALTPEQMEEWLPRAHAAEATRHDHPAWFFGRGRGAAPRWAGYTLGFLLVGRYLAANPEARASALLGMHAARLLRDAWP
ncbi:putative Zn-dependent protease DUF2268 [Humitalea rosea]|uniref:Putative Zn-dependent protease DUF2268 n=1 Tax=Humitalea rosea TaxID=990373 RepID=A0A2W7K6H1_9PROT|nr:DUF2268 domain-containing putative Zn-dependent protease [Humitalea rosea]PZW43110.1 putative Zn-dependent protease DUF2268 [Humitalea rosea]